MCYVYDDPTYIDGQNDTGVETYGVIYTVPENQSYRGHYGQHAMGLTCALCNVWYNAQGEASVYAKYGRSEAFARMRENIADETYQTGFSQLSVFANYFAPDRWTMYSNETGMQQELWESRYHDGVVWSALMARNIAKLFDVHGVRTF